jgi:molybdopterin synthase catalytic subunit
VRGVLGTRYVPEDTALEDGAVVCLLPPVSGGSDGPETPSSPDTLEAGLFEIHDSPLDPGGAWRRVSHPSCGAVCVFTGTTRERNRGEDVVRLDYEAFGEMAGAEMERIFEECLARFGPPAGEGDEPDVERRLRMLCLHRTGAVDVGEPSVVIAVASPHRDAAFRACRFLLDELKARVPLWKKEIYAGGHHWINDRS